MYVCVCVIARMGVKAVNGCVCVCVTAAPTLEQLQVVIIHHPCKPVNPLKFQQS